ncbi:MAG: CPBP family intramembrane metalloprotease [bacterium]|nr:CPBP family intramembrane metalloprotease [bacterium]
MERIGAGWRLPGLIALILALTFGTAGLFKLAIEQALPGPIWLQEAVRWQAPDPTSDHSDSPTYDLGRAVRRYLLVVAISLFIAFRHAVPWAAHLRRGFRLPNRWYHLGWAFGVASIVVCAYFIALGRLGFVSWTPPPLPQLLAQVAEYTLGAFFAAALEETLFRGAVFRSMLTTWQPCKAIIGSSALFAVLHCISGGYRVELGWEPFIGIRLVYAYFSDRTGALFPESRLMIGFFLLAALLAYLYLKSGTLWTPIGAHAGLVLISRLTKTMTTRATDVPEWFFGDRLFIVSGVLVWGTLVLLFVATARWAPSGPLYQRLRRHSSS